MNCNCTPNCYSDVKCCCFVKNERECKVWLYTRFVGQHRGEIALWKQTEKYDYRINEKRKCDFFFLLAGRMPPTFLLGVEEDSGIRYHF